MIMIALTRNYPVRPVTTPKTRGDHHAGTMIALPAHLITLPLRYPKGSDVLYFHPSPRAKPLGDVPPEFFRLITTREGNTVAPERLADQQHSGLHADSGFD